MVQKRTSLLCSAVRLKTMIILLNFHLRSRFPQQTMSPPLPEYRAHGIRPFQILTIAIATLTIGPPDLNNPCDFPPVAKQRRHLFLTHTTMCKLCSPKNLQSFCQIAIKSCPPSSRRKRRGKKVQRNQRNNRNHISIDFCFVSCAFPFNAQLVIVGHLLMQIWL